MDADQDDISRALELSAANHIGGICSTIAQAKLESGTQQGEQHMIYAKSKMDLTLALWLLAERMHAFDACPLAAAREPLLGGGGPNVLLLY